MRFEYKIISDDIREKMFDFVKPEYEGIIDGKYGRINWCYGIADNEAGWIFTHVKNFDYTNTKYVLANSNGDCYFFVAHRDRHNILEIPDEIKEYSDVIENALKTLKNAEAENLFLDKFSVEEQEGFDRLQEAMVDRSKRSVDIFCYEDAKNLLIKEKYQDNSIYEMYNKNTVANFKKYMPEDKRVFLNGERFKELLEQILSYRDIISEEDMNHLCYLYHQASYICPRKLDDLYEDMVFEAIKRGHKWKLYYTGYIWFGMCYLKYSIKYFRDKVKVLKPLIDYINKNLMIEELRSWEYYRRELDKIINDNQAGFQFVLTSDEIKQTIFNIFKEQDMLSEPGLNFETGIYDKDNGIFMAEVYASTPGREVTDRCYKYFVMKEGGPTFTFYVSYEFDERKWSYFVPPQYEYMTDKIKEGIALCQCDKDYRMNLSDEDKKKIKDSIANMKDRISKKSW